MSVQTAHKFLELLSEDPAWQTQFFVSDLTDMRAILRFAYGKGFIMNADDLAAALRDFPASPFIDDLRRRMKAGV